VTPFRKLDEDHRREALRISRKRKLLKKKRLAGRGMS
jgi:hypothetical protein